MSFCNGKGGLARSNPTASLAECCRKSGPPRGINAAGEAIDRIQLAYLCRLPVTAGLDKLSLSFLARSLPASNSDSPLAIRWPSITIAIVCFSGSSICIDISITCGPIPRYAYDLTPSGKRGSLHNFRASRKSAGGVERRCRSGHRLMSRVRCRHSPHANA